MHLYLLDTPYNLSLLAKLGRPSVKQPTIDRLIEELYTSMFSTIISQQLIQEKVSLKTRLFKKNKKGIFTGKVLKKRQHVVVVDILRSGIEPAHIFYNKLCEILDPRYVRQDHIMTQRVESGNKVTDTHLMSSKIGGSIKNRIVFIPDPMGATGHTVEKVIKHYIKNHGKPKKFVIVNLVISPQYKKHLEKIKEDIHVYVARKDKGLTDDSYIIPGLGGLGETINNTRK